MEQVQTSSSTSSSISISQQQVDDIDVESNSVNHVDISSLTYDKDPLWILAMQCAMQLTFPQCHARHIAYLMESPPSSQSPSSSSSSYTSSSLPFVRATATNAWESLCQSMWNLYERQFRSTLHGFQMSPHRFIAWSMTPPTNVNANTDMDMNMNMRVRDASASVQTETPTSITIGWVGWMVVLANRIRRNRLAASSSSFPSPLNELVRSSTQLDNPHTSTGVVTLSPSVLQQAVELGLMRVLVHERHTLADTRILVQAAMRGLYTSTSSVSMWMDILCRAWQHWLFQMSVLGAMIGTNSALWQRYVVDWTVRVFQSAASFSSSLACDALNDAHAIVAHSSPDEVFCVHDIIARHSISVPWPTRPSLDAPSLPLSFLFGMDSSTRVSEAVTYLLQETDAVRAAMSAEETRVANAKSVDDAVVVIRNASLPYVWHLHQHPLWHFMLEWVAQRIPPSRQRQQEPQMEQAWTTTITATVQPFTDGTRLWYAYLQRLGMHESPNCDYPHHMHHWWNHSPDHHAVGWIGWLMMASSSLLPEHNHGYVANNGVVDPDRCVMYRSDSVSNDAGGVESASTFTYKDHVLESAWRAGLLELCLRHTVRLSDFAMLINFVWGKRVNRMEKNRAGASDYHDYDGKILVLAVTEWLRRVTPIVSSRPVTNTTATWTHNWTRMFLKMLRKSEHSKHILLQVQQKLLADHTTLSNMAVTMYCASTMSNAS